MTATTKLLVNKNFLGTNGAEVLIHRMPAVSFMCQKCTLPGVSLDNPVQPTPIQNIPQPGDSMKFDFLSMTFMVDEDMSNWLSMFKWITGLGSPQNPLEQAKPLYDQPRWSEDGVRSTITQLILDNQGIPNLKVRYDGCLPMSLTQVEFDTTRAQYEYATASAVFMYTYYEIEPVNVS